MSGLQAYITKNTIGAYVKKNIVEEIEKFKKINKKLPIIVIDGSNSRSLFCEDDVYNYYTGGQFKSYKRKIDQFFDYFEKLDIELVAFFDACKIDDMRERWIERKRDDIRKCYDVLDSLDSLENASYIKENKTICNIGHVIKACFIKKCRVILSTFKEGDAEIITYANEHKALAILSQDVDFTVAQGDFMHWSFKNMDLKNNVVYAYDREMAAKGLKLKMNQLPLLRTMIGNDYILQTTLENWFCRLHIIRNKHNEAFNNFDKIKKVAMAIKNYSNSVEDYKRLSKHVFGTVDKYDKIQNSVESYFGFVNEEETLLSDDIQWKELLLKVLDLMQAPTFALSSITFDVMHKQVFEMNMIYEDFRKHDIPPAGILWRDIRSKIYGILLKDYPFKKEVKEWICTGEDISEPTVVMAVEPICNLNEYKLLDFWNTDKDEELINTLWSLFCSTINKNLIVNEVRNFDKGIIVPTLILLCMNKKCNLTRDEIDAFLIMSILCSTENDVTEYGQSHRGRINTRLLRLSTVFLHGLATFKWLLEIIFFIIPRDNFAEWNVFDGAVLQSLHRRPIDTNLLKNNAKYMLQTAKNFIDNYKCLF